MEQFKKMGKIILASASPRRSLLLKENGIEFDIEVSRADELDAALAAPEELVLANARIKAEDVASRHAGRIVLGADTVVAHSGTIFGKPRNLDDARRMLKALSGKIHSVYTGIALIYAFENGQKLARTAFEESFVKFRKLDDSKIEEYLEKVDVLDKAGAYAAQEHGSLIIEEIQGEFDNVMGLPCKLVKKELDMMLSDLQY